MSTAFQTPATGGGDENSACHKASKKSTSVLVTVLMQLENGVMSSVGSWFSSKGYREKEWEGEREREEGEWNWQ